MIFLNSQSQVQSGTAPQTSRKYELENQEYDEDRSQNDPQLELGTSVKRFPHSVNLYEFIP